MTQNEIIEAAEEMSFGALCDWIRGNLYAIDHERMSFRAMQYLTWETRELQIVHADRVANNERW